LPRSSPSTAAATHNARLKLQTIIVHIVIAGVAVGARWWVYDALRRGASPPERPWFGLVSQLAAVDRRARQMVRRSQRP